MPSVGIRRSTRVLGARVLRSGRRLWTEPQHEIGKFIRSVKENEWIEIFDSADEGDAGDHCKDVWLGNSGIDLAEKTKIEKQHMEDVKEDKNVDIMCGIVYVRKRKREEFKDTALSEDTRFGKKYKSRQGRKKCRTVEHLESSGHYLDSAYGNSSLAVVATKTSFDCGFWIACFLTCVLSYMKRVRIGLRQLSAFLHWKPMYDAYTSHGVLFIQDSLINNPGKCIILGSRSLMPIFTVDFSAIPFCFMNLHVSMHLRSVKSACVLVVFSQGVDEKVEQVTDMTNATGVHLLHFSSVADHPDNSMMTSPTFQQSNIYHDDFVASSFGDCRSSDMLLPTFELPELVHQNSQFNNGNAHQKISSRRKRGRQPSGLRTQKTNGDLLTNLFRLQHNAVPFPSSSPTLIHRSLDKKSPSPIVKDKKSPVGFLTEGLVSHYSAANLLIIETDKCYREEGAIIMLELSPSNLWTLAVLKNGMTRFTVTAQKVMRPSCCNRFNHAIIWTVNDDWKLEFPIRKDWLIFKELYKECSDCNELVPVSSFIRIPGVKLVSCTVESNDVLFVRPDLYISVKDDELVRALMKRTANYDLDSDDELWLEEFNNQLYPERDVHGIVTPESFELIVDALEKGFHCYPDDHSDEKAAYEFCMHLETKEIVEAIHNYWVKKRRQKRSALIRIFQLYQPRRTQVIPKSVLRKKRSFKRQASQAVRDKQRTLLQALVAERESFEQQSNLIKVQEATTVAGRSEQSAFLKRQRAQILMKNADVLTYKAMVSLRIAEASAHTESQGTVASFFLG